MALPWAGGFGPVGADGRGRGWFSVQMDGVPGGDRRRVFGDTCAPVGAGSVGAVWFPEFRCASHGAIDLRTYRGLVCLPGATAMGLSPGNTGLE